MPASYHAGVVLLLLAVAVRVLREIAGIEGSSATVLIGIELALGFGAVVSLFRWAILREKEGKKSGT